MRATVRKWGNSAAIRIPGAVLQAVSLQLDQAVEIREEDGRIVIEPVRQKTYDLDELIAGITSMNRHSEVDFGPAIGNEAL